MAETRPAIIKPNREPKLADLNIAVTRFPAETPLIRAGATSPVVVRGPEPVRQVPTTSSAQAEQPTPARVVSLSALQAQGPVVIPLANQTGRASGTELLAPQRTDTGSGSGNGNPASKQNGIGAADGPGSSGGAGNGGTGSIAQGGTPAATDAGAATGSSIGDQPSLVHLTLPKDGQFGVVVVGSSLTEQYPEIAGIWGGRLVYTVYLRVGSSKTWILQYSLPRADEAAAGGNITRPEAPWPYDILRPHLSAEDYNSDAIIVHGFINLAGRFERLALVFPSGFAQAKFVLNALQQWQFRPARQNGQIAAVEVLLIIPEEATP